MQKLSFQVRLVAMMVSGLLVMGLVAFFAVASMHRSVAELTNVISGVSSQREQAHLINLDFRRQVQEWKNVLLRGHEPDRMARHWGAFSGLSETILQNGQALSDSLTEQPDLQALVDEFLVAYRDALPAYDQARLAYIEADFDPVLGDQLVRGIDRAPSDLLIQLGERLSSLASQDAEAAMSSASRTRVATLVSIALITTLALLLMVLYVTRSIRANLGADPQALRALAAGVAKGDYEYTAPPNVYPGSVMQAMGDMVDKLRRAAELEEENARAREEQLKVAVENARIRQALDNASINVMIADANRDVIYINKALQAFFVDHETQIRADLPAFRASELINQSIDRFHRNPRHQMQLLEGLTAPHQADIELGGGHFRLTASPIRNASGERLGTVVEWLDRTREVAAAKEIRAFVDQAKSGDFSAEIDRAGKDGFFLKLAEDLNELRQIVSDFLDDMERMLQAIAERDLTVRIDKEYEGRFDKVKNYANRSNDNLGQLIGEIRAAAETIATAAREISAGNTDLSSRTEEQASSLEETASSMEELTSTVRQNADNAKEANSLSDNASMIAVEGGEVVSQMVNVMERISQSSREIADIIGVIDGIAFQTNILALNAAVEAARAGEQGRGFAVVASEVRSLAQRSASAAKDIKELISQSVRMVETGDEQAKRAGKTMEEIVEAIRRVREINSDISAASDEQASGIDNVSTAVSQMDEMTQQNAALVEEAAAAAESQLGQVDELNQLISQFRLDDRATKALQSPASRQALPAPSRSSGRESTKRLGTPDRGGERDNLPARQSGGSDDDWDEF